MCGIVFNYNRKGYAVNRQVWNQYQKQKSRGQQGFGYFDGKFTVKAAEEKRIKRYMSKKDTTTNLMLFHHRFPTSTINVKQAAHPFNTGDYFGDTKYILVHNGVIRDPDALKKKHEEMGITYQSVLHDGTYNDSEALLWDFALAMEGKQEGKMKAYGGIAFVCIKLTKGKLDKMFFGRNYGRPLNLHRTQDSVKISSEGEGEEIEENKLYTYNYTLNRLTKRYFKVPSSDPDFVWEPHTATRNYQTPGSTSRWGTTYGSHWEDEEEDEYFNRRYLGANSNHGQVADQYDDSGVPYRVYDHETKTWIKNPKRTTMSVEEIMGVTPNESDITAVFWQLLHDNDGYYEHAYYDALGEFYTLQEEGKYEPLTWAQRKKMKIYELVGNRLLRDPEYVNEGSRHPMWVEDVEPQSQQVTPGIKSMVQQALINEGAK